MPAIDIALGVLAIAVLVLVTAFYVAGEFALVAVDRNDVERQAAEGSLLAANTARALTSLSFQLSGAQLGITVSSVLLGIVAEPVFARILAPFLGGESAGGVAAAVGLGASTLALMVVGELTPKTYAISKPLPTALYVGGAMRVANAAAAPAIKLFNGAANATLRLIGIEPRDELRRGRSLEELEVVIRSAAESGALEAREFSLIAKSFEFAEKTAADALVRRTALVALPRSARVPDLVKAAVDSGHSRFPVYGADIDDIVGVVHVKDAYRVPAEERDTARIDRIMHAAHAIPETLSLSSLLVDLRARGQHMAVVVDEYGGTAGIITMEDVLEEIVGDIEDEYDTGELQLLEAQPLSGVWQVDGMLHRDELADVCSFFLPAGEWETLAGFLLHELEHIPQVGERVEYDGWTFTVREMDRRRVARVEIRAPRPAAPFPDMGQRA